MAHRNAGVEHGDGRVDLSRQSLLKIDRSRGRADTADAKRRGVFLSKIDRQVGEDACDVWIVRQCGGFLGREVGREPVQHGAEGHCCVDILSDRCGFRQLHVVVQYDDDIAGRNVGFLGSHARKMRCQQRRKHHQHHHRDPGEPSCEWRAMMGPVEACCSRHEHRCSHPSRSAPQPASRPVQPGQSPEMTTQGYGRMWPSVIDKCLCPPHPLPRT